MEKRVIVLHKKEGETPLFALEKFRKKHPEYLGAPMTYAGRLDPMASGVLVILAGKETKNKEKYLNLDKKYDFRVLFGFSTDTHDILGKVLDAGLCNLEKQDFIFEIKRNLKYFKGKLKQAYPIYSSKTVAGKPLFSYARGNKDVKIPERQIFIKKLQLKKVGKISNKSLFLNIKRRISKMKGDFRQAEILTLWKERLQKTKKSQSFYVAEFQIECSSGTYVRKIADSLGEKMKIPSLAFSIKRTKVGKFGK